MLNQLIAGVGAALVLAGYFALQRGWLDRNDRAYNAMNFFGAAMLTWVAVIDGRWGFIILESVWALLSLPGLIRGSQPPGAV